MDSAANKTAAYEYRNAQVTLALATPQSVAHWVRNGRRTYGDYSVTEVTAALQHGRGSDECTPVLLDRYLVATWMQAHGWDTSWMHF